MIKNLSLILLCLIGQFGIAQDEIWIHPNRGQWHDNISYKIKVPGGNMYLEKTGFTYDLNNSGLIYDKVHHHSQDKHQDEIVEPKGHTVKTTFVGANPQPLFKELNVAPFYENYFLGNDSSNWASNIYPCQEVNYLELYNGIDLSIYEVNSTLKYDIIIEAGVDPTQFKVKYEGQDELFINQEGELVMNTSLGSITESKPIAFQKIEGVKRSVKCEYVLEGNEMHFSFPEGYDSTLQLTIDPQLAFSTFTGSTADNWGMTASPDQNGNLIAGGIVLSWNGGTYPTTTGAYSSSFGGGTADIGLTKFTSDGTGVVFSTYIGGNQSETPISVISDNNNNIVLIGGTGSSDFPITGGAFQSTHQGGPPVSYYSSGYIDFDNGVDIYVLKLNPSGSSLLGSTFYGGSSTEGQAYQFNDIIFNYGDGGRGEVMIDDQNNIYISSFTQSSDIAINGGFQSSLNGTQDAIIAKFNPSLTNLMWSSYLGGSGFESGNSIQIASNGDIYVAGGTTSSDLPFTSGQINSSFQGGTTDGYVVKLNAPTYNNPKATYLGTSDYDQAYFVQLDLDDNVYVYGQTKGDYPISGSVYNNPNSGQFIHKLNTSLTSTVWSSSIGAESGNEEISPTAFLVSDCYEIYIAGWGGNVNTSNSSAVNSSTNGLPVTSGAFQTSTSGSNFYLAQFSSDLATLEYGTFMGDINGNGDHVDGGTSRFSKDGSIYHAVCAACGGNSNGFPTTPGVYSETNNSSNCNLAAFLFELGAIEATLSAASPIVCIPDPVIFQNDSQNGNQYFWDFGDGNTSTAFQPSHSYQNPGVYTVMLVVTDAAGCYTPDTAYIDVEVQTNNIQAGSLSDTICPGTSVELWATGGDSYVWGPPEFLDDPNASNPIATINDSTTFTVDVSNFCGSAQLEVTVHVFGANASAGSDVAICAGDSTQLFAGGGDTYSWSHPESLSDPNSGNPWASPIITTDYTVEITTPEGCLIYDTVEVWVDQDLPYPILSDEVTICKGQSRQIVAGGATSYTWSPNYNISATDVYNPIVNPTIDTTYYVTFTNACGDSYDSVHVNVIEVDGYVNPDTIICPEGEALLNASGGVSYEWRPPYHLSNPHDSVTTATPHQFTTYTVYITDAYGCKDTLSTHVDVFDSPNIEVSAAEYAIIGDTLAISADGNGTISWSPPYNISCIDCNDALVWPEVETIYTATITDNNGCENSADVPIHFDPLIYVPNAFTPNGDHYNNTFKAIAHNVVEYEMLIFNRWGELIAKLTSPDQSWDGSYKGILVKDDVYVWLIKYTDINGNPHELRGHVTVLK